MGFRFRKSVKVAPGVRLNFGKKSAGISFGGKGAGVSINSKTGTTSRVSIPGTGLSYTETSHTKRRSSNKISSEGASNDNFSFEEPLTLFLDKDALASLNNEALLSYSDLVSAHAQRIKVGDDALYGEQIRAELSLIGEECKKRTIELQKENPIKRFFNSPWFLLCMLFLFLASVVLTTLMEWFVFAGIYLVLSVCLGVMTYKKFSASEPEE